MSNVSASPLSYAPSNVATAPKARLGSLDVFRGMTIACMMMVNNLAGPSYDALEHAHWNGWTPTDLVFPFFAFIMGVAIPFSFGKRASDESRGYLFAHVLTRGLALFLLGEFGYALPYLPYPSPTGIHLARYLFAYAFLGTGFVLLLYPWKSKKLAVLIPPIMAILFAAVLIFMQKFNEHMIASGQVAKDFAFGGGMLTPDHFRIPGVLQRLGVLYAAAGSVTLIFNGASQRVTKGWKAIALVVAVLLIGYVFLIYHTPYTSLVDGKVATGRFERTDNLARYVDETVLGSNAHPASWGSHTYNSYPDPEGIISTIPAIGTTLLGVLAGMWLRTNRSSAQKCAGLLSFGVLAIVLATFTDYWVMPINKNLWTSSYVIHCAGLSLLGLGTYFYLCDVLAFRRIFAPLTWYGMNAITVFVLAGIMPRLTHAIRWANPENDPKHPVITLQEVWSSHLVALGKQFPFGDHAANGSLAYAISFSFALWIVAALMYRFKIFLKV